MNVHSQFSSNEVQTSQPMTIRDRSWIDSTHRNKGLITQKNVKLTCHSFQGTEFKFHMNVNDYPGQVVEGLTILPYPRRVRNKGLITQKREFDVHSHSQGTEFKLTGTSMTTREGCRGVDDSTVPLGGSEIKG